MPYNNRGLIEIDLRTKKKLEWAVEYLRLNELPYKYITSWNDFFKVFIRQVEQLERGLQKEEEEEDEEGKI